MNPEPSPASLAGSDPSKSAPIEGLSAWLRSMPSVQDIEAQLRKADAIREWCLRDIPFREGDRVRIARELNTDNGWRPYKEALAVGATATVLRIDFNRYSFDGDGAWHADIRLDREWSHSEMFDGVRRWWNGRASETPEGMQPPSKFDQEHYPEGRRHVFSVLVDDLEALTPDICPTCSGRIREMVGMVCQTCGTDYATDVPDGGK